MKKTLIAAVGFALMLATVACNQTPSGKTEAPKTTEDSAACAYGLLFGSQMNQNLAMAKMQGMNIDSAAFMKGLLEALQDSTKRSFYLGASTGAQMLQELVTAKIDVKKFANYFVAAVKGDSAARQMTNENAQKFYMEYNQKLQEEEMLKKYGKNKEDGEKYLADFKKGADVKTTPKGVAYKTLAEGTGATPAVGDTVEVRYIGKYTNGEAFDKGTEEGKTFKTAVTTGYGGVIEGWVDMLTQMKVGQKVTCVIPYKLGYGANPRGMMEPYRTLVFDIELVKVKPGKKEDAAAPTAAPIAIGQ